MTKGHDDFVEFLKDLGFVVTTISGPEDLDRVFGQAAEEPHPEGLASMVAGTKNEAVIQHRAHPMFEHSVTGDRYLVVDEMFRENDLEPMFFYISCKDGTKWARSQREFMERFTPQNSAAYRLMEVRG